MKLKGKTAIVTGASQGIGKGIALELANAGANVVINYNNNQEAAAEVKEEINHLKRNAITVKADVSKQDEVTHLIEEAIHEFQKIDILVNNAGIFVGGPIENLREEDWERVIDVNLKGAFLCCQAVGKNMILNKSGGSIINIASISGSMPEINLGAYTPSKAGMIGLTRLLAIEWAKYDIRVNSISPGPIMTALQRKAYNTDDLLTARNDAIPLQRHGKPEEIGKLAVFLASDDSSFITGEDIKADGGSINSLFFLVHRSLKNNT